MGRAGVSAVPHLIRLLTDSDAGTNPGERVFVRAWSAQALGNIGPPAKEAVPALERLLNDREANTRQVAAIALGRIEGKATMILIDLLASGDNETKWQVIQALGESGPRAKDALPSLYQHLTNSHPLVRLHAEKAIKQIEETAE